MKLIEQKTENHQAMLTVELEPEEVETSMEATFKRMAKETTVPGFRKGKAPRDVLERHIGRQAVFDEAMQDLIPRTCTRVIEEQNIEVYARPTLSMTSTDPVTFQAVIPLRPVIELGDYNSIRMKLPEVEIKEEQVDMVVNRLQRQCATWEEADGPVTMGNLAVLDVESNIGEVPYISQKGAQFQLGGSPEPVLGFTEEILGMEKGAEKEFTLKFPEKHPDTSTAGKEVHFKVTLTEIRQEKLPELNDEFVKTVTPGIETLEALRDNIRRDLKQREEERVRLEHEDKVTDALVEISKLEFPPQLVESEIDNLIEQYHERVRRSVRSQEEYDHIIKLSPEEKLRKDYLDGATTRVKRNLVVAKLVEAENLETSDEEVDHQIERFVEDAGDKQEERRKMLNAEENRYNIKRWHTARKAIKLLVDIAQAD